MSRPPSLDMHFIPSKKKKKKWLRRIFLQIFSIFYMSPHMSQPLHLPVFMIKQINSFPVELSYLSFHSLEAVSRSQYYGEPP